MESLVSILALALLAPALLAQAPKAVSAPDKEAKVAAAPAIPTAGKLEAIA